MDEQVNEVVEEVEADGQFAESVTDEEFDSMWDDEESSYDIPESDMDADGANQPAEAEVNGAEGSQGAEGMDADQYLELKHFDEVRKVSKEEAKTLAQKGLDYDRIRGKLDEANSTNAKLKKYEDFLTDLKGDFETVDDLINDTKARALADREGITYEQAAARIEAENARPQAQQIDPETIREMNRRESLTSFLRAYPEVKAKDIPQEVWDDMKNNTNNLVASYAKWEARKLASENEILKQNAKNASRSTGSMNSSGGKTYKDAIDAMWYEDDY